MQYLFCCSLFSQSGQSAGQAFGQQGVYNNMSITVSMAGGSSGASSLPPMAQAVGNSNLNNVLPVCSDQQVCHSSSCCHVRKYSAYFRQMLILCFLCIFICLLPFDIFTSDPFMARKLHLGNCVLFSVLSRKKTNVPTQQIVCNLHRQ